MSRRRRSQVSNASPATTPDVAVAPPAGSVGVHAAPQPVQRFYVRIENLMQQTLVVSVLNERGSVESLRLAPRGKSHPIEAHRVGSYTRDLEKQGRVRIVT